MRPAEEQVCKHTSPWGGCFSHSHLSESWTEKEEESLCGRDPAVALTPPLWKGFAGVRGQQTNSLSTDPGENLRMKQKNSIETH